MPSWGLQSADGREVVGRGGTRGRAPQGRAPQGRVVLPSSLGKCTRCFRFLRADAALLLVAPWEAWDRGTDWLLGRHASSLLLPPPLPLNHSSINLKGDGGWLCPYGAQVKQGNYCIYVLVRRRFVAEHVGLASNQQPTLNCGVHPCGFAAMLILLFSTLTPLMSRDMGEESRADAEDMVCNWNPWCLSCSLGYWRLSYAVSLAA